MVFHLKGLVLLSAALVLYRAWRANRQTSLRQALTWAVGAWGAWLLAATAETAKGEIVPELRYVALCLTGCTGVAVLGARRPGVGPWNFVVAGLLAVLLLPFAEGWVTGKTLHLDGARAVFLGATLAVGVVNYLPTRLAGAALGFVLGCACEMAVLTAPTHILSVTYLRWPVLDTWPGLVLWGAFGLVQSAAPARAEFDRLWLDFRNRFGLVWGQRLREQFNNAARHAGWPVVLRWQGLRLTPGAALPAPAVQDEILATLRALMKRFGPEQPLAA